MDQFLALEVWAASLAAAGAIGWLVGEAQSARRQDLRDGPGYSSPEGDDLDSLFTLSVPPKIASKAQVEVAKATALPSRPHEKSSRRSFADMPEITALRAEARKIRASELVWDAPDISESLAEFRRVADPGSVQAMEQYRRSIEELRYLNLAAGQTEAVGECSRFRQQISAERAKHAKREPLVSGCQGELPLGYNSATERRETGMIKIQARGKDLAAPEAPPASLRYYG